MLSVKKLCVVYAGCVPNVTLGQKSSRRTNTLAYIGSTYFARKPFGWHNCFGRLLLWPTQSWSTKWFGRHFGWHIFFSTKIFGRQIFFGRQNFLVDQMFYWHFFVDKMFWSTPFLSTKSFGRQNLLVDKNVMTNKTLLLAKRLHIHDSVIKF